MKAFLYWAVWIIILFDALFLNARRGAYLFVGWCVLCVYWAGAKSPKTALYEAGQKRKKYIAKRNKKLKKRGEKTPEELREEEIKEERQKRNRIPLP